MIKWTRKGLTFPDKASYLAYRKANTEPAKRPSVAEHMARMREIVDHPCVHLGQPLPDVDQRCGSCNGGKGHHACSLHGVCHRIRQTAESKAVCMNCEDRRTS